MSATRELRLGPRVFGAGETVVMAIVNRTPDSFFDRGRTFELDRAMDRVDQVVGEGAHLVDAPGEPTRAALDQVLDLFASRLLTG